MLTRLGEEHDGTRRALVFGFPRGVAMLKQDIGAFVDDAFGATRYDRQPWLRGVYLTSATQEGTPIDPASGQIARSFGLGAAPTTAATRTVGRSYFLGGLLKQVIFPEAELVGSNRSAERRRAWLHAAAYTLVACGVAPASIYYLDREFGAALHLESSRSESGSKKTAAAPA